jgi:hypothetical protein
MIKQQSSSPGNAIVVAAIAAHQTFCAEARCQAATAEHILVGVHSWVIVTSMAGCGIKGSGAFKVAVPLAFSWLLVCLRQQSPVAQQGGPTTAAAAYWCLWQSFKVSG